MKLPGLKQVRLHRGLTQGELAEKAKVSQHHLSRVERGIRGLNPLAAEKLAEALEVDLQELTEGPEPSALPKEFGPRPPDAGSEVTSRYLHRAYLQYVLAKEVGTAYSSLTEEELERYCKDRSWEGVLEMLSSRRRELEFVRGELEDDRLPMEVRLFFEEIMRESRDRDIRVLAAARSREPTEDGREKLTQAMRGLL